KEPQKWISVKEKFVQAHPGGEQIILAGLLWMVELQPQQERHRVEAAMARKILTSLFPGVDAEHPPFINAASALDQVEFIVALQPFPSADLDQAVAKVFSSSIKMHLNQPGASYGDQLVFACLDRLHGKGLDADFANYLQGRIDELSREK